MFEKFTVWCQKGAFAGGRGAVSTKRAPSWVKGTRDARRTPLLAGGAPYTHTRAPSWAKNGAFSARRAPSLAQWALYLLKKTQSCAERALFCTRRARLLVEGALFQLRGRYYRRKGAFSWQKSVSAGGSGVVSP